jgi:hypothetical protein
VRVHTLALDDHPGSISFFIDDQSMGGWISKEADHCTVRCATLDDFAADQDIHGDVSFAKLDAAGNEAAVIKGGASLLKQCRPIVLSKLYNPAVTYNRFGYSSYELLQRFEDVGYQARLLEGSNRAFGNRILSLDEIRPLFEAGAYCLHVIGLHRSSALPDVADP